MATDLLAPATESLPARETPADRRRPGRVETTNPALIALYRAPAGKGAAIGRGYLPVSAAALAFWAVMFVLFT